MAVVKLSGKSSNNINMISVRTRRGFCLTAYPIDSSASVFSIICSQDFEEDVGVGAIVGELQEAGETAHTKLQGRGEALEGLHEAHHLSFRFQGSLEFPGLPETSRLSGYDESISAIDSPTTVHSLSRFQFVNELRPQISKVPAILHLQMSSYPNHNG